MGYGIFMKKYSNFEASFLPIENSLTVNIEAFPDNKDATVDFPTPLPPTMDTNDNWVLKSGMS